MNPFDLNLNFRVIFSPGASGRVGEIAQMYKARRVMIVMDQEGCGRPPGYPQPCSGLLPSLKLASRGAISRWLRGFYRRLKARGPDKKGDPQGTGPVAQRVRNVEAPLSLRRKGLSFRKIGKQLAIHEATIRKGMKIDLKS